jgi:DNA-binding transcriptional regulator YiaG
MQDNSQNKIATFLIRLKEEIYNQKMSKADFARKMHVSVQTVHNWLSGRTKMSLQSYYQALEVLGAHEEVTTKNQPPN